MPLTKLWIHKTSVSDLTPIKSSWLRELWMHGAPVNNLSPLKELPLKTISCDFKPERDTAVLRSIKTLEKINNMPVAEFWKQVEAGEVPKAKRETVRR